MHATGREGGGGGGVELLQKSNRLHYRYRVASRGGRDSLPTSPLPLTQSIDISILVSPSPKRSGMKGTEVPNPRRSSACDSGMRMLRPCALIRAAVGLDT